MKTPSHRWQPLALFLALIALCLAPRPVLATTIYQAANSQAVAWEGEDVFALSNTAPTFWVATNDAPASGGSALYQAGDNKTDASSSFATYAIKFRTPGTYSLYVRWRADKARSDQDPNGGNSYRVGISLGDLANDPTSANFGTSSANNTRVPPDANNYAMIKEATTFTVSQQDVDAGAPLLLKIGTREWGMFLDRFVLSLSDTLVEADFNAVGNSETDLIPQGANEDFIAFEAERAAKLLTATPTLWVATNDAPASGGGALYQAGDNKTDSSSSFALYTLKFRTPGTYSLYVRWRADKARSDQDPNGGNSYRVPISLGDLENDPASANFATSSANNTRVPPDANNYAMIKEATTFTVSQQDVDAGKPLWFKIGTREWGMFLDRFAFSLKDNLTEADFNSLPNSGAVARPNVLKAVGAASLNTITVSFDRGLKADTVIPANFTVSGGLTVTAAALNAATAKDVILTTSGQTAGTGYTVTVNKVADAQNNAVSPNSKASFISWKLSSGWVLRELFFGAGTTVADLMANQKFIDNKPDTVEFVRQVAILGELQVANYGARLTTFFTPPQTGAYEFYLYGDDDAELVFSVDEGAGQLQIAIPATTGSTNFDANVSFTSPNLTAGQRYLLQVNFQQGAGAASLAVGARLKGATGPVEQIPVLGGSLVSTYVNPEAGLVNFRKQPLNATVAAFARARFSVEAVAASGGLLFYQWQVNGANIPGANRATYVTPVLGAGDNGKKYRCVVSVNGGDNMSQEATVTVIPGEAGTLQPYVGIQFVGGSPETSPGSPLGAAEVAGVVPQENFNAINGGTVTDQSLVDATGAASPVKLTLDQATTLGIGAGTSSADRALFQGCIKNDNTPLVVRLTQVPAGTYNLVVYSVGFNFNTTYEEDISLEGGAAYPTYYVWAQHAGEYAANPAYLRMSNTNPSGTRDRGNHVVFENIKPAADGSLVLTVTPQSANVGGTTYLPPLNALQLVKVVPVTAKPTLAVATQGANAAISWGAAAAGFRLESSPALGAGATWTAVAGVANPLTGAGNVAVTPAAGARFYRLKQ